jgi:2-polyprenyl-6-methoxyphenol hydroxylase-like FAD-dependent oxidoreductase
MSGGNGDQAVVLGGSVAGLLTASVLADSYRSVVVVERDLLPPQPDHRRGVPHGRHAHGLLPSGLRLVEELLPGFTAEAVARGALLGDILGNCRWYLHGAMLRQAVTGLTALSASRPLIETGIRDAVRRRSNVTFLDGHDVAGITTTPDRRRVVGARVTSRLGENGAAAGRLGENGAAAGRLGENGAETGGGERLLPADLVVDCTGRASRAPRWLAELGYAPPGEDVVGIDLSYATRVFAMPAGPFGDDLFVAVTRYPGQRRSGIAHRLEGGRALVTLAGVLGERPPADLEAFTEYARTLAVPDLYEIIRFGTPVGDGATFRCPTYVRRRFERLADFPSGFLVLGDAACAFNPVYGQGMAVAAAAAVALRDHLREPDGPDPRQFFAAQSRLLDAPWALAAGADLALPGVTGPPLPPSPLTGDYLAALQHAAAQDAELAAAFIRVTALVDPPSALMSPAVRARLDERQRAST